MRGTRSAVRVALATIVTGGLLLVAAVPAGAGRPDEADAVQVSGQDVYVIVGSTLRHPDATTDPAAHLFTVAGVGLGRTWGEWSAATATSTARTGGGRTDVRLTLGGLVPGGVYSVFWGTLGPDSENPNCPDVERTLPLPGFHVDGPDASSFVADQAGAFSYRGRLDQDLLEASQVFFTVIYHFDGETYDPLPNRGEWLTQGTECRSSFGEDAMRQLLVLQQW